MKVNLLSSETYGNARVEEPWDHCLTNSLLIQIIELPNLGNTNILKIISLKLTFVNNYVAKCINDALSLLSYSQIFLLLGYSYISMTLLMFALGTFSVTKHITTTRYKGSKVKKFPFKTSCLNISPNSYEW